MELWKQIQAAGIVGCGGAGFPTHIKYQGTADTLIINGAECEPLLYTDQYLMQHCADEIISAVSAMRQAVNAQRAVIALKHNYTAQAAALNGAIVRASAPIQLHFLNSFFPAGDEQTLVYEVTGQVVPPGGLPGMAGCVVSNAATALCVHDAMAGRAFTHKYLTVTGAVRHPTIVYAPVGTPVADCLACAGGTEEEDFIVINGGPMMGKRMTRDEALQSHVTKTMSGLIVLPVSNAIARSEQISLASMFNRARSSCIQCSYCTQLCPRHLLGHPLEPHRIMRRLSMCGGNVDAILDDPAVRSAALCCECGICETVACPMQLQPRRVNRLIKQRLSQNGIRYQRPEGQHWQARPERSGRLAPSARVAVRAGVAAYTGIHIDSVERAAPHTVSLALRQGARAAAQPLVHVGDRVSAGQQIAACPAGQLGAHLHASVSGMVADVSETHITITSEQQGGSVV